VAKSGFFDSNAAPTAPDHFQVGDDPEVKYREGRLSLLIRRTNR